MTISQAQWYYSMKINLISHELNISFEYSFIFQVKFKLLTTA